MTPPSNTLARLLNGLELVHEAGPATWRARCPVHKGAGDSLSISEEADGRILVHCFAGCSTEKVVSAVGLKMSDLSSARTKPHKGKSHFIGIDEAIYQSEAFRTLPASALKLFTDLR